MRGKRRVTQDLLRIALALSLALYPVMSIAQNVTTTASPSGAGSVAPPTGGTGQPGNLNVATPAKAVTTAAESAPAPAAAPGRIASSTAVYLRVDSNLAGRVSVLDPTGKKLPAKAHVSFIQRGRTVSTADANDRNRSRVRGVSYIPGAKTVSAADANERGEFQVHGLQPGVYSVIATGPDGFAVLAVQVLPYAGDASRDQSLLNLTLVSSDDADALAQLLGQTDPQPDQPPCCPQPANQAPICGGGGGGGGGGLGGMGMLGLAMGAVGMGLGIGALASNSASPSMR